MTDNASKNGLANLLKGVGHSITSLIGFVTAVVGAYRLYQDNRGLVTTILLTLGLGILWLSSFYMYLESRKGAIYPLWIRRLAFVGIFAVPILAATGYAVWQYYPTSKIIVLVANFEGPEPQKYRVTETIVERLREATKKYGDVRVQALEEAINALQGSETARRKGDQFKATIVLWGWYGVTAEAVPLSVHFDLLRPPKYMPELGGTAKGTVQKVAVAELQSFAIQAQLSKEMAYLTLFSLGMVSYSANDWATAIARFTDALSQTEEGVPALDKSIIYRNRGVAYSAQGDYNRAIADYDRAIQAKPDSDAAYINRALAYSAKGDYDRAIADFDQAIKLKPDSADAYNGRGDAYYRKRNLDQATADFSQAINLDPKLSLAYYNRGVVYSAKDNLDQAIADYAKAINLDPKNASAYNNRGNAYRKKGSLDQALSDLNKVIELDPKYGTAYLNRGIVYFDKGKLDQAIADYTTAIEIDPKDDLAYNNRGNAYRETGNLDQALTDLNKATDLNPELDAAYKNRGLVFRQKGLKSQAIAEFETYLRLSPNASDRAQVQQWLRELKGQ